MKITHDKKTCIIVKNILNICNELNIKVIAKGVETKEEFERLKKLGCKYFQGYYFYQNCSKKTPPKSRSD